MKVAVDFNEGILFYAFRYAIGRRTYAVKDVVNYLFDNWYFISGNTKKLIIKEINQAIEKDEAGMDCDIEEWNKILDLDKEKK